MTKPKVENTAGEKGGLECRKCGCRHFRVVYTRRARSGKLVRRRECRNCGKRMTTIEQEKGHGSSD